MHDSCNYLNTPCIIIIKKYVTVFQLTNAKLITKTIVKEMQFWNSGLLVHSSNNNPEFNHMRQLTKAPMVLIPRYKKNNYSIATSVALASRPDLSSF